MTILASRLLCASLAFSGYRGAPIAAWVSPWSKPYASTDLTKKKNNERDRDEVAANKRYATLSKECKGRGKEIAALRKAVANLKKGKRDKEVEKAV